MIGLLESLARPMLRMLDPEDAHRIAIHGLRLVAAIKSELSEALRRSGQARIDELVGADAAAMTAETWPT